MARSPKPELLESFKPIDNLTETTQKGNSCSILRNVILRPVGGFKGPPRYDRLWAIGSAATIYATITALDHPSIARTLNDSDNTVALRVTRQGKNFLFFYNLPNRQCRGLFYFGDDGTYTSGSYDFTAGSSLAWEVLATDLDDTARWYGTRIFKALFLGNGVNDNVVAQLGRSATPGKWRKAASNIAPAAPVISLVQPATSTNVQASLTFTRSSGKLLTFTAKDTLYPGIQGNNKIRIRITNTGSADALASNLSGQGTVADPYYYVLVAGSTSANSSTDAVVSYVNTDSRVSAILSASKDAADATQDPASYGPSNLDNGSGTGTSAGFSARTVTFYARYWDPGAENYGYEGVSSPISNTLVIDSSSNNDIRVLVPVDGTAEGGRFSFLRLYMQFGEDTDAAWLLMNPDDPVPNGLTGTFARLGSTDYVTLPGSQWAQNDIVQATTTGTLPAGLSTGTDYYLQPRPALARTFTRIGSTNGLQFSAGGLAENDVVRLTTDGTLPTGLAASTNYYLRPRTATGTFTRYLSTNEITLTGSDWAENDVVRLTTTGTLPAGLSAGVDYYLRPGTATGRWTLSLSSGGAAEVLSSSGSGTHSAVLSPAANQWFLSLTSGGSAVTVSSGGSGIQTATLTPAATQWFFATSVDATTAVSLSSDGSGTHTATLRSKCVQIGTQTPFLPAADGGEMFDDQSRPLPHTLHAFAGNQVWLGGVTDYPERLYASKPSTADEVAPEGCSLDDQAFVPVFNQSQRGGTNRMTALQASQNRLDVHYDTGITMLDPSNTELVNYTTTTAGAVNATCITNMEGKGTFFLAKDLQLRQHQVEQTGAGFAATVANSQFAALAAVKHLRDRVDLAELARKPQRTFLFPDAVSQHLWMSLPGTDGSLKLFGYDLINAGIIGELDYPQIYAACQMEPDRPEIIFADESGNLFVYDPTTQQDNGDTLGTQTAFTTYSPSDPIPVQYAGYGYVDSGGVRYYQAATSVLETGMLNLTNPALRKALVGLLFRTVTGSRGIVTVTVTALNGTPQSLTLNQASFYANVEHRLNLLLGRTTAIKLKFEILGAEQKGWIIRDVSALWTDAGRA